VNPSNNANARHHKKGALMVTGAASLWGTFSLFFRPAEKLVEEAGGHLSAATECFILLWIVFVVLSPSSLLRKPQVTPPKSALFWLFLFSVADALNVLLYFGAMQRTSVAVAVLTHYLQPVIVALLSPWVMREARQRGTGWAALGAVIGLALLLDPVHLLSAPDSDHHQPVLGATMGALSAVLFATVVFSIKKLSAWFSSNQIQCLHFPGALLILYAFIPPGEFSMGYKPAGLLLLAGLIPGTLGGYLFVEGLRHLRPSTAGILTLLEPIVALLVGILFWKEHPSAIAFVGASVILFSAYQVLKQRD
jgi:drug/metabolite transporter (DMT)-like permease